MARPRAFDERQVLDSARDLFWTSGYASTRMDDVASVTGLGKGSLYGAFGGKRQLFLTVFEEYCAGLVISARTALEGPDDGAGARLVAYLRDVARNVADDARHRGCLLAKGAAELSEADPEVAARTSRALEGIGRLFADTLAAAQRAGEVDPTADPAALAAMLLAVLRGVEALGKAGVAPVTIQAAMEQAVALIASERSVS